MEDLVVPRILLSILAFGMIIFIHEFGHFLAAVKVGVRVEKFYLGFDFWGMKLFKFDYKGTEYGIGVFPLGGYVKMAGQNDFGESDSVGAPDEFISKTVWERIQVLSAGVIFNFISAFFFMGGALLLGHRMTAPIVGEISKGSPAWKSELQRGDKILKFQNMPITSFDSLATEVALSDAFEPATLEVERNGEKLKIQVTPELNDMEFAYLGFEPIVEKKIEGLIVDGSAEKQGMKPGDVLEKVNGQTLNYWAELYPIVQASGKKGESLEVEYSREGKTQVATIKPKEDYLGTLGVYLKKGREINAVRPNTLAEQLGIKAGMKVKSINGQDLEDGSLFNIQNETSNFPMVFETGQGEKEVMVTQTWKEFYQTIHIESSKKEPYIEIFKVIPNTVADKMGLKSQDKILAFKINDSDYIKEPTLKGFELSIKYNKEQTLYLKVKRGDKDLSMTSKIGVSESPRYLLGLKSQSKAIEEDFLKTTIYWPINLLRMTYKSLVRMFALKVSPKHINGPVGISKMMYAMSGSFSNLFYFLAILSISIAFFNCLPIPVLDGGQLMFCLIEWVKGSPVSDKFMEKFQYLGFAFILALLVFATWNDLTSNFF